MLASLANWNFAKPPANMEVSLPGAYPSSVWGKTGSIPSFSG
jgi:hypothetical protein